TRPRGRKVINLSKQSTITWSPVSHEPSANAISESKADGVTKSTVFTADKIKVSLINLSKFSRRIDKLPLDSTVLLPSTFETVPAHTRFAHLAVAPVPAVTDKEAESVVHKLVTPVSTDTELTQTEEKIPTGLPLPSNFRALLEMFRSCDTVVSMLHNRKELCSFDKLKPAVQEVVRRFFIYRYFVDGTQSGHDSPSKGHLVFTGTRLIQRRNRFHRLLLGIVMHAHREFLKTLPGVSATDLPDDTELRRWHPKFALDTAVPPIKPSPLPIKPSDMEQKITTAKDAVRAFQARALFLEAEACQNVAASRLQNVVSNIPSPTKASACSPRKVRARENERRFLTELTKSNIPESRRAVYAHLPSFIPQVWTVMRTGNGRPLPLTVVAGRIAGGYHGGLSVDTIMEHLNILIELCPSWLQKLDWTTPHLKVCAPKSSVKEILDNVKDTLLKEGYQL
ncbi:hypothetical protein FGIG_11340, partial [Fasciola gigantica]